MLQSSAVAWEQVCTSLGKDWVDCRRSKDGFAARYLQRIVASVRVASHDWPGLMHHIVDTDSLGPRQYLTFLIFCQPSVALMLDDSE